jgi:hypothetical protein
MGGARVTHEEMKNACRVVENPDDGRILLRWTLNWM